MRTLRWWMRIVGVFYLMQFVAMVIVRAPIRAQGPAGTLARAAAGDPLARFVVDTWVTFGLEVGAIGVVLLIASRLPEQGRILVWSILAIELARGIVADIYLISRGNDLAVPVVWLVLHSVVIATGLVCLRGAAVGARAAWPGWRPG
jgi:hypothetical protein